MLHFINHHHLGKKLSQFGHTSLRKACGQKAAALACGLPLLLSTVLPGCLPQKDLPQTAGKQTTTSAEQVVESGLETIFDAKKHLTGTLIVDLRGAGISQRALLQKLKRA